MAIVKLTLWIILLLKSIDSKPVAFVLYIQSYHLAESGFQKQEINGTQIAAWTKSGLNHNASSNRVTMPCFEPCIPQMILIYAINCAILIV